VKILESPVRWHDSLWTVARPHRVFSVLELGTRCTLVRLPTGGLLVHSPVALDERLIDGVRQIGDVEVLVAPNRFHHLFVAEWQREFPEAGLWGAPGLAEKRDDLRFDGELGDRPEPAWASELDQCVIHGAPALSEVVFHHGSSGTLLVADLLFNIHSPRSRLTRLYLKLAGVLDRAGCSRLVRAAVKDRRKMRQSLERVLGWDFERVILAHGQVIETGGHDILRDAYAWL
jgi:hypothetical protein